LWFLQRNQKFGQVVATSATQDRSCRARWVPLSGKKDYPVPLLTRDRNQKEIAAERFR